MSAGPEKWMSALTALLAVGGLAVGFHLRRPSWLDPPPPARVEAAPPRSAPTASKSPALPVTAPVLGFVDMKDGKPRLFARKGSKVEVSGWAATSISGSVLRKVVVLVDGVERGMAAQFYARPDVAAAYGRPEFERSGWKATVDLDGIDAGTHTLTAQGFGAKGEQGQLPPFVLQVLE